MADPKKPAVRWVVWHPNHSRGLVLEDEGQCWRLVAASRSTTVAALKATGWQSSEVRNVAHEDTRCLLGGCEEGEDCPHPSKCWGIGEDAKTVRAGFRKQEVRSDGR